MALSFRLSMSTPFLLASALVWPDASTWPKTNRRAVPHRPDINDRRTGAAMGEMGAMPSSPPPPSAVPPTTRRLLRRRRDRRLTWERLDQSTSMMDNSGLGTPSQRTARIHPDNESPGRKRWVNNRLVSAEVPSADVDVAVVVVSGRNSEWTNSDPGYVVDDADASAHSGWRCC